MTITIAGKRCTLHYPKKGTIIHEVKTYLEGTLYVSYRVTSPPPSIQVRVIQYRWVDNKKLSIDGCEGKL